MRRKSSCDASQRFVKSTTGLSKLFPSDAEIQKCKESLEIYSDVHFNDTLTFSTVYSKELLELNPRLAIPSHTSCHHKPTINIITLDKTASIFGNWCIKIYSLHYIAVEKE
jgi:hypothetical protein